MLNQVFGVVRHVLQIAYTYILAAVTLQSLDIKFPYGCLPCTLHLFLVRDINQGWLWVCFLMYRFGHSLEALTAAVSVRATTPGSTSQNSASVYSAQLGTWADKQARSTK